MRLVTSADDFRQYDKWIQAHPQGSLWQSLAWKKYQEALGREVRIYIEEDERSVIGDRKKIVAGRWPLAAALVVIDRTAGGYSTWEIGRGPLGEMNNGELKTENGELLMKIIEDAKKDSCISLFVAPPINFQLSILNDKFSISHRHIFPDATRIIDLQKSEEEILKQMKQKGRYNIKVAKKNGVIIKKSDDVDAYYALAKKTADRDGFTIQRKNQYGKFLKNVPGAFLMLAYLPADQRSIPIAGLIGVIYGDKGIYYYGASDNAYKAMMAPYLLQWTAIAGCKAAGCASYDLFGVAPPDAGTDHPWSGISAFKEKFGGTIIDYPTEREIVLKSFAKRALMMKRRILG